jgi:hypothetical protein
MRSDSRHHGQRMRTRLPIPRDTGPVLAGFLLVYMAAHTVLLVAGVGWAYVLVGEAVLESVPPGPLMTVYLVAAQLTLVAATAWLIRVGKPVYRQWAVLVLADPVDGVALGLVGGTAIAAAFFVAALAAAAAWPVTWWVVLTEPPGRRGPAASVTFRP